MQIKAYMIYFVESGFDNNNNNMNDNNNRSSIWKNIMDSLFHMFESVRYGMGYCSPKS